MKIYFKTLGCDKNFVDSEKIAGFLTDKKKFEITNNIDKADIVIINTCSFIQEAVEENINTILEFVNYRNIRNLNFKIVVVGCLTEIYKEELQKEIPEVDIWIRPGEYHKIDKIISKNKLIKSKSKIKKGFLGNNFSRAFLNNSHYKFLKISDGCNLVCSYCIIPKIRGKYKSRKLSSLKRELGFLSNQKNIKELIIVSQNTSYYGSDKNNSIIDFLDLLGNYNFYWKRLMYLDIRKINEEFLIALKRNNILPYFDIPLQHINKKVLQDMNRNYDRKMIMDKIKLIKKYFKDPLLRTTFIVGFPTEGERKFKELYKFVKKGIFNRIGIFEYSHQPLSIAYNKFDDNIDSFTKTERFNRLNKLAEEVLKKDLTKYIDSKMDVLIDDKKRGRIWRDAPEIDSCVIFNDDNIQKGQVYETYLQNIVNLELKGEIIDEKST